MGIQDITARINQYASGQLTKNKKTTRESKGSSAAQISSPYRISLSDEAKLLQNAGEAARTSSGIRQEKTEVLKEKVRSGEYQPDFKMTAKNILKDDMDILD